MVLLSIQSTETGNGYRFSNDFAEALVIDPNARVTLINVLFERKNEFIVTNDCNEFIIQLGSDHAPEQTITIANGTYTGANLAKEIENKINTVSEPLGYYFNVIYNREDGNFKLSSLFHLGEITPASPTDYIGNIPFNNGVMNTRMAYNVGTNTIDLSGVK